MSYLYSENLNTFSNGCFIRRFRWNVKQIISSSSINSGYIVQYIDRDTKDSNYRYTNNGYASQKYWEAWPVRDGAIDLPDNGYDDCWSFMPEGWALMFLDNKIASMLELFIKHKLSTGNVTMNGWVYWAPEGSQMEQTVKNVFQKGTVSNAGDLLSVYAKDTQLINGTDYVYCHCLEHHWDLSTEQQYEISIVDFCMQYICPEKRKEIIKKVFNDDKDFYLKLLKRLRICEKPDPDGCAKRNPYIQEFLENRKALLRQ